MNSHLEQLALEAQFKGDRYALDHEFRDEFARLIILDLESVVADPRNYRQHVLTTWDQAQAQAIVASILTAIRTRYGIQHHMPQSGKKSVAEP
jgi:hypothetical protein